MEKSLNKGVFDAHKYELVFFASLILFLLNCIKYAAGLNLWGDEAFFMNVSGLSCGEIMKNLTNHSPAYSLFLKMITFITGASYKAEIYIRVIHAVIFTGGLYFGYKTLNLLFGRGWFPALTLVFIMLIPGFTFYATNIKMYSLVFCFAMWLIYAALKYLNGDKNFSFAGNWDILLAGFLLILSDYVGLLYYFVVVAAVVIKIKNKEGFKPGILLFLIPLALVAIFMGPGCITSVGMMLKLPLYWLQNGLSHKSSHVISLIPLVFNAVRPFVELTDISYIHIIIPVMELFLFGIFLVTGSLFLIRGLRGREIGKPAILIIVIAFLWILTSFTSSAITRVFLPAQFFMGALIIYGLNKLKISLLLKSVFYVLLICFNLFLAINPVYHLSSMIPYNKIARDVLAAGEQYGIDSIVLSDNTLDVQAVKRYILQDEKGPSLMISGIGPDFTKAEVSRGRFLFLSFMGEDNKYVDADRLIGENPVRRVSLVKNYIELDKLPFNRFWKKKFTDGAMQKYACMLYIVE